MSAWVCTHCGQPVELVPSGAWWRHVDSSDIEACGIRLSDDAYNVDEDRYYQQDDDDDIG